MTRRTSRMLPAGVASGATLAAGGTEYRYYGDTETIGTAFNTSSPVCGLPASTPQYGALKQTVAPAPAVGAAIVTSSVFDLMGRVVGVKRTGDTGWTCTSYDARSRVTQVSYPAFGNTPARVATFTFGASGNLLVSSAEDPAGKVTSVTDLLGRATSYTDVWGTQTTMTYNLLGQALEQTVTPPVGEASTKSLTYNAEGQGHGHHPRRHLARAGHLHEGGTHRRGLQ